MQWNLRPPGRFAIERRDGPCSLVFSRQALPHQLAEMTIRLQHISRGAYVLKDVLR